MRFKKFIPVLFLIIYLLFIFYITLFARSFSLEQSSKLEPFWSYVKWFKGANGYGREILLNIALFIPLGYYLVCVLKGWGKKRADVISVGVSLLVSVSIETVQYIDGLGLCEFDDVFNNVLGACLGIGIYHLCSCCISAERLQKWRLVLSVLFLMAGIAGCNMVTNSSIMPTWKSFMQFDFDIKQVSFDGKTYLLQGYCYAYDRDTPGYQIVLQGEKTGKLYKGDTKVNGKGFRASIPVDTEENYRVMVKFKVYKPVNTFIYINKDRLEYVNGTVPEPDIRGTDLSRVVSHGILKAHNTKFDVYVYQVKNKLYWLIGTPVDKRTEIICRLYTNEPGKLPKNRRKFKFDNLSFQAGGKDEITKTMRCGKYRVFEKEIPSEYNITAVRVGFHADKKVQWGYWFRLKRELLLPKGMRLKEML